MQLKNLFPAYCVELMYDSVCVKHERVRASQWPCQGQSVVRVGNKHLGVPTCHPCCPHRYSIPHLLSCPKGPSSQQAVHLCPGTHPAHLLCKLVQYLWLLRWETSTASWTHPSEKSISLFKFQFLQILPDFCFLFLKMPFPLLSIPTYLIQVLIISHLGLFSDLLMSPHTSSLSPL